MLATHDLEVLVAVASEGSFSRAAAKLYMAQPSVSERVSRLERQLGKRLFSRSNRGVRLTAAGRQLLPYAERCVTLCAEAVAAVQGNDAEAAFHVLMHSSYAPTIMAFVLDVLADEPLEISNNDAHSEHVVAAVSDGVADVGFAIGVPHPHNVRLEPFYTDQMVCVASNDHPLVDATELTVSELADYPLAINGWGEGLERFTEMLRAQPRRCTSLRTVSPGETAVVLARVQRYIAVCAQSTAAFDLAEGRLVKLPVIDLPRWAVDLFFVYRHTQTPTHAVETLRSAVATVHASGRATFDPVADRGPEHQQ